MNQLGSPNRKYLPRHRLTQGLWRLFDLVEWAIYKIWIAPLGHLTRYAMLVPAICVVGILFVSVVVLAESSFHILDLSTFRLSDDYSFDNYIQIITRPLFTAIFVRSLIAATIVTGITLVLAFPYAYVMVRSDSAWQRKMLLFSLFLPFFLGQVVRAYGWLILLGREGLANTIVSHLGIPPLDLIYNYPAVIVGLVQYMLPFAVLMIAPAVVSISKELEQASEGLGANWIETFRHIVLPLARPGIMAAVVVVFTITLTDFAMPAIMGGGKSDFVANLIYSAFFNMSDSGLGSALSVILVFVGSAFFAVVMLAFGQSYVRSSVEK